MKTTIGVAGFINAGKSLACKILSKNHSVPIYSFSKLIEGYLLNEGAEISRLHLQNKGIEIINQIGYSGIAGLMLEKYSINLDSPCIIEGIRHVDVCNYYREFFRDRFKLIFIDCSREIRFERIKDRMNNNIVINNIEDFIKIENHSVETDIEKLKDIADFIIDNSSTIEKFSFNLSKLYFK